METSAKQLREAADSGDNDSRFALGLLYLLGRGVDKNAGEAFKLFGEALEAGDPQADHFRDIAAEHLAKDALKERAVEEAMQTVKKEAERRRLFPKPKLVKSDD